MDIKKAPMKDHEIGFYVRVRWQGVDALDAQHRAEEALGLLNEQEQTHDAGPRRGGVTKGLIRIVTALHKNEVGK